MGTKSNSLTETVGLEGHLYKGEELIGTVYTFELSRMPDLRIKKLDGTESVLSGVIPSYKFIGNQELDEDAVYTVLWAGEMSKHTIGVELFLEKNGGYTYTANPK